MDNIKKANLLVALAVAVLTYVIFVPALQNQFINWDDDVYIYDNSFIRSMDARFFKSAFLDFPVSYWHPLTWISHAIDYRLWGLNPVGHHLMNIVVHALNALIVVFLVIRLLKSSRNSVSGHVRNSRAILIAAMVTGLLFGLHPLRVESVAWAAERKDLLCALFFLLSLMTYTKYVEISNIEPERRRSSRLLEKQYLLTVCLFILALMSKPMAVTLPFVLLILDWYPFRRVNSLKTFGGVLAEKLPFIVLSIFISIVTVYAQQASGALKSPDFAPFSARWLVGARSLVAYLWKMILPLNLVPFYPYPRDVSILNLKYFLPVVLVAGITLACIVVAKKRRLLLSIWGYYVITLLPVLGIIQAGGQSMADRYSYLPSLGPFLLVGLIIAGMYENIADSKRSGLILRMAPLGAAVVMLVFMSVITVRQIDIWKNSFVFWNYIIEKEPAGVPLAYNNLGLALKDRGRIGDAISQYQTAIRLDPNFGKAYVNLGNAYKAEGRLEMAIQQYQTVLRLNPNYAEVYNNLGVAYKAEGQLDNAIQQYQTALRLNPNYAEAHNNLGNACARKGHLNTAIEQYQMALRLKPDYRAAHFNLGLIYKRIGDLDMARREFELSEK